VTRTEPWRRTSTGPDAKPRSFFSLAGFASGCLSRGFLNHGQLFVGCGPSHLSHLVDELFSLLPVAGTALLAGGVTAAGAAPHTGASDGATTGCRGVRFRGLAGGSNSARSNDQRNILKDVNLRKHETRESQSA